MLVCDFSHFLLEALVVCVGRRKITSSKDKPDNWALEIAMNWSIYTADRSTHLKIVLVGVGVALLISVISIAVQQLNLGIDIMTAQGPTVIKAGAPVVFTDRSGPIIR